MNFVTQFAHAGHMHAEASDNTSMLVLFGGIAAAVVIVAIALTVMNRRKKPAVEPADDIDD